MDQFVTTYRKDYLWPYIRTFGKRLVEPDLYPAQRKEICPCYPPNVIDNRCHESYNFDTKDQDWSRTGPMGPLLDPKLYPVKVGKSPETNTMQLDQPNMFLRKLHEKYPFLYEILQAAPDAKLNAKVNQDRLKTTYQVDYCKQEDNPPDNLMRASGFGNEPCSDSVKLPCDSYHFNAKPLIHRPTTISKMSQFESKSKKCRETNSGKGDTGMDIWTFNNTEYQDGISKIGALIIRDRLHYHNRKVH